MLREMFMLDSAKVKIDLIWNKKGRVDDVLPTGNWKIKILYALKKTWDLEIIV